ncbi:NUDIX domain-containing protein [Jannaschia sp. W003]|uniref:NUDIX domain-containing protein n=1 Tax=Jannaschia sp. W003 TaxID=2867012 RepID=UPI0021A83CD7|nr:NUDIX domain-containing protein [Jannaschia sp. W003]UWQ22144.1 NUDIX domain-containing protein [Jannaschia sp. W003]
MIPRHGPPPARGVRHRLRPGAYAILLGPRGLLLTEQTAEHGPEIQLPGGGIDPGESALPALAREVLEETGHACRILCRLGAYRRFTWMHEYGFHAEKLCHVYLGRAGPRRGPPLEAGHRAVWMAPGAAAGRLASPGDAALLRAWLARGGARGG